MTCGAGRAAGRGKARRPEAARARVDAIRGDAKANPTTATAGRSTRDRDVPDERWIRHGGGINGFMSSAIWIPERKVFVAVLSNAMGGRKPRAAFAHARARSARPHAQAARRASRSTRRRSTDTSACTRSRPRSSSPSRATDSDVRPGHQSAEGRGLRRSAETSSSRRSSMRSSSSTFDGDRATSADAFSERPGSYCEARGLNDSDGSDRRFDGGDLLVQGRVRADQLKLRVPAPELLEQFTTADRASASSKRQKFDSLPSYMPSAADVSSQITWS